MKTDPDSENGRYLWKPRSWLRNWIRSWMQAGSDCLRASFTASTSFFGCWS